jgi:hypothetical protein
VPQKAAGPVSAATDNEARDGDALAGAICIEATRLEAFAQTLGGARDQRKSDRIEREVVDRHLPIAAKAQRYPPPKRLIRRGSETFSFHSGGLKYVATSRYPDGRFAEIFISFNKSCSNTYAAARDSSIALSIALQFCIPVETIRHVLLRDARGIASSPVGVALDITCSEAPTL